MFLPYFLVIIDFSIEDNSKMLQVHGLLSTGNIKYRKPVVVQLQVGLGKGSLLIRATMPEIVGKLWNIQWKINRTGYAAHG